MSGPESTEFLLRSPDPPRAPKDPSDSRRQTLSSTTGVLLDSHPCTFMASLVRRRSTSYPDGSRFREDPVTVPDRDICGGSSCSHDRTLDRSSTPLPPDDPVSRPGRVLRHQRVNLLLLGPPILRSRGEWSGTETHHRGSLLRSVVVSSVLVIRVLSRGVYWSRAQVGTVLRSEQSRETWTPFFLRNGVGSLSTRTTGRVGWYVPPPRRRSLLRG